MRKTLYGARYDTDRAELLGTTVAPFGERSPRYWVEQLYRSPRGKLFVAGRGGAWSRWAKPSIRPMTAEESRLWLRHATSKVTHEEVAR